MALTFSQAGSANSTTSGATLNVTGVTAAVGDMLIVCISADNSGSAGASSISSVTDAASNTYTSRALTNRDPGAANAGNTLDIFTTIVTSALSSQTVTVNFSPNTPSKAAVIWKAVPGAGETARYLSSSAGASGAATTQTITTTSIANGDTVIGATSIEGLAAITADSDTSNGNWSAQYTAVADTGSGGTSQRIASQHKTVTATATQTYNTSTVLSNDFAINYIVVDSIVIRELVADAGSYTVTGTAANLEYGREVAADAGSYAVTGSTTDLEIGRRVVADAGSYSVSGVDATLTIASAPKILVPDAGSYAVTGSTADLEYGRRVVADAGSYAVSGTDADLEYGREVDADAGSYAVSGTDASLEYGRRVTADAGSYSVSGQDADLERGLRVSADAGAYAVTGQDADLEYGRRVAADSGSYAVNGTDAGLILDGADPVLSADAGAYNVSGTDASLEYGYRTAADAGSYAVSGTDADLEHNRRLVADAGSYTVSGQNADLEVGRRVVADAGSYSVSGTDATLTYAPIGALTLVADAGSYSVSGQDAGTLIGRRIAANDNSYEVNGSNATLTLVPVGSPTSDRGDGVSASSRARRRKQNMERQLSALFPKREDEPVAPTAKLRRKVARAIVETVAGEGLLGPEKPAVSRFVAEQVQQFWTAPIDYREMEIALNRVLIAALSEAKRLEDEADEEDVEWLMMVA
jgi:hypothetical protein